MDEFTFFIFSLITVMFLVETLELSFMKIIFPQLTAVYTTTLTTTIKSESLEIDRSESLYLQRRRHHHTKPRRKLNPPIIVVTKPNGRTEDPEDPDPTFTLLLAKKLAKLFQREDGQRRVRTGRKNRMRRRRRLPKDEGRLHPFWRGGVNV